MRATAVVLPVCSWRRCSLSRCFCLAMITCCVAVCATTFKILFIFEKILMLIIQFLSSRWVATSSLSTPQIYVNPSVRPWFVLL